MPVGQAPNRTSFKPGNPHGFTGNDDPRRVTRGRPSKLNDPDFVDQFAEALVKGLTRAELAETFEISEGSVKTYKKDPRIKAAALKYTEDRIIRITSKTDAKLDALLASDDFKDLPIDDQIALLLKVRKEYLGGAMRMQAEGAKLDSKTISDAMDAMEDDPEFAKELRAFVDRDKE